MEGFSIIMPTYNQAHFIRRAILSVLEQTYKCWELIIIDDGCTDSTERYIQDFLGNSQIRYLRNEVNQGIGYSINRGLEVAKYDLIAYLPSDDYYYKDHLLIHKKEYDNDLDLFLTFTKASSKIEDCFMKQNCINAQRYEICNLFCSSPLQLVQTVHRNTSEKWETCNDVISKDYYRMYWSKLVMLGGFKSINFLTCCWSIYSFKEQIQKEEVCLLERKFLSGNIDKHQKDAEACDIADSIKTPLKILLVGELSHNPDRILALKDADVSIAMGSGSDIARQVSQFIIIDGKLQTLVEVVREGRLVINNVTRSASMYYLKTIYTILLSILSILMNIPYPFIPFQMTLLDMFIEGFPSFMILFERNIEKPKESIGHHAMRFSLPNALAIVLSVAGIRLLAPTLQLSLAETFSVLYFTTAFVSIHMIYRIYKPLNWYRGGVLIIDIIGFILSTPIFWPLLEMHVLTPKLIQIILITIVISIPVLIILTRSVSYYLKNLNSKKAL